MTAQRARRLLGSALLVTVLLAILTSSLPDAPGLRSIATPLRPVALALGLDQRWTIFAPDPRRDGIRVEGRVAWSDGVRTVWRIPERDPVLGAYSDYRWRKWAEWAASDAHGPWLWRPAAEYIVRTLPDRPGARPEELVLVRLTTPIAPPGRRQRGSWTAQEVYRAQLGSAR